VSTLSRDGRGRVRLLGLTGLVIFTVLSLRIFCISIIQHGHYMAEAIDQQIERVRISPERGRVYDRNGTLLAYSVDNPTVIAETAKFTDPVKRRNVARTLSTVLELPAADLEARLSRVRVPTVILNRKATPVLNDDLKALKIPGIRIESGPKRVYPLGAAAAHVTGFVNTDQAGAEGTEVAFEKELQGTAGWATLRRDAHGGKHMSDFGKPAVRGSDLLLTIDSYLQEVTSNRLNEAVKKCNAKAGWALVVDPRTGDILAMANAPTFDPTFYDSYPTETYRNHIVSDGIEPGSTFKAVTVAAALEEGVMRPDTPIDCMGGRWMLYGKPITDHEKFWTLPFIDTFVHSSNVAMAQVGLKLGPDRMYHYLKKFGFGQKTGLGLPGEEAGYLKKKEQWSGRTPATIAFGYEIRVTSLQLAMAYAALANNGILMKPRLVKEIVAPDGTVLVRNEPEEIRRVVTEKTAQRLLEFMGKVVTDGTGREAALDWCVVGGKTGTARKYDNTLKAYVHKHYASFIGVAPLDHPRLLCYVVIDEPKGNIYGASTAAPAFKEIIEAAGKSPRPLLRPDYDVVAAGAATGRGESKLLKRIRAALSVEPAEAAAETTAARNFLQAEIDSAAAAAGASPFDNEDGDSRAETRPAPKAAPIRTGPKAPNLVGMSLRLAFQRVSEAGLDVTSSGDGFVVVRQYPAAGEPTRPDSGRVMIFMGTREDLDKLREKEKERAEKAASASRSGSPERRTAAGKRH
jgi:cell division protein FtsI/penicillin-binding protein 2